MTQTLYRRYRPQSFADVIGQEHIKLTLEQELKSGKIAHAYLFCGMRGVGKTTLARLFAKSVNCEQRKDGQSEPCNDCESCRAIAQGRSLDLIEIDAASNRRIDDVRELRDHIPLGTASSRYKVIIVDEVHMLTPEAFNALLKTLEEPPAHAIFILATTEVHKLPDTIISRCQRFDFRRIPTPALTERLHKIAQAEGIKVDQDVLAEVVHLASGSSRDAESYLGKLLSLGEKHITRERASLVLPHSDLKAAVSFVTYVVARQAGQAVELLNNFLEEGGELAYFYRQVLELLRQLLLYKLGGKLPGLSGGNLGDEVEQQLEDLSRELTQGRLQSMLQTWLEVEGSWQQSEVYQLPLELAAVEMSAQLPGLAVNAESAAPSPIGRSSPEPNKPIGHKPAESSAANEPVVAAVAESGAQGITLDDIQKRWLEVVAKLREFNHSLSFILSIARPAKLEGRTLTISFQYKLHQERVQDPKMRQAIEQALVQVLAVPVMVQGVLDEAGAAASGDLLASVLNTFGGQVVE